MSVYNLGGWPASGWYYSDEKYGLLGNNFTTNNLLTNMYKGNGFNNEWSWTHGGVTSKELVANEKLPKNVAFFYGDTKEMPRGTRVICRAGFICSEEMRDKLNTNYGFSKGDLNWGWAWSHPWLCVTSVDDVAMNEYMVFPASYEFSAAGFKIIGTHQLLIARPSNMGKYESNFSSGWDWKSFQLVSPPNDTRLVIESCKSSLANANKPECSSIMKFNCSADDIKSSSNSICNSWCRQNPSMCDSIKINFCSASPNDPYCDCINHSSRAAYIEEMKLLRPESRSLPLVCNTRICNTRTDLADVFHTSSYLKDKADYKCPALQIIDQSVNVNGTGNNVSADQKVNNSTGGSGGSTAGGTDDPAAMPSTTMYLLVLLFIILVIVIAMNMGGGSTSSPVNVAYLNPRRV